MAKAKIIVAATAIKCTKSKTAVYVSNEQSLCHCGCGNNFCVISMH